VPATGGKKGLTAEGEIAAGAAAVAHR